ncbi:MAG: AAA family ATPase [Betaproteobacteria bacterium]|nr:AAA family ATPase [Betaproteobacteria bacterium]
MIQHIQKTLKQINHVIYGKPQQIKLAFCCLLARGHLLIEDVPGVGKTVLSHILASSLGLNFNRIQFTSDLLPADILGSAVYEPANGSFRFHAGPIFNQVILADEINRATPKTQSALLEAMEEQQVSIEGKTRPLPKPFFVIATQNPGHQIGTFPLPESQLDRFLMCLELGYPDVKAERRILAGENRRHVPETHEPAIDPETLQQLQQCVERVHMSEALLDYVQAILSFSRTSPHYLTGLSPRAGLALVHAARAWALIHDRDHVLPEDIQQLLPYVAAHRLHSISKMSASNRTEIIAPLTEVAIP